MLLRDFFDQYEMEDLEMKKWDQLKNIGFKPKILWSQQPPQPQNPSQPHNPNGWNGEYINPTVTHKIKKSSR